MAAGFPDDFIWAVDNLLAATSRPYDVRKAFEFFKDQGIDVIVTLTENSLLQAVVEEFGFEYHHIPVRDFAAPSARQIDKFIRIVEQTRKAGRKVVVHCLAGRGRTGTMIACYLVFRGRGAQEALDYVRSLRAGAVETAEQEQAVFRLERRRNRS